MELHNTVEYAVAEILYGHGLEADRHIRNVVITVSEHTGIGVDMILGKRMFKEVVYARFMAMHLLKKMHGYGVNQIARIWGFNHSTVVNAHQQVADWRSVYQAINDDVRLLGEVYKEKYLGRAVA